MRDITTLRIELGISAERLVSQMAIDNRQLESLLADGIKKGIEDLVKEDGMKAMIAQEVKETVRNTIREATTSYALKHKIHEAIFSQLDDRVSEIAREWGDTLKKRLDP